MAFCETMVIWVTPLIYYWLLMIYFESNPLPEYILYIGGGWA